MRTYALAIVLVLAAGCSAKTTQDGPFVSSTDATRTLDSLSTAEATSYCTDVVKYQRSATEAEGKKVTCGSFARIAAVGAKTDADAVAACKKSFDDCMAKPPSTTTSTDECKDAYASLQKCKGTGTTVADMNGCLTESTDQLVALASTDWCAGLKAGVVKTEPKAAMGPKCTAVQTKCPALWSSESTGGGATPPSGG